MYTVICEIAYGRNGSYTSGYGKSVSKSPRKAFQAATQQASLADTIQGSIIHYGYVVLRGNKVIKIGGDGLWFHKAE